MVPGTVPDLGLQPVVQAVIIRIRPLLDLRGQHGDQALLDYLTLVDITAGWGAYQVHQVEVVA